MSGLLVVKGTLWRVRLHCSEGSIVKKMVSLVLGKKLKCCLLSHTEGLEDFSYKAF